MVSYYLWLYQAVPVLVAGFVLICSFIQQDVHSKRLRKGLRRIGLDRKVVSSIRWVIFLSIFINICSFSLSLGKDYTTVSSYLKLDMEAITNSLHGCFILGGYSNYIMTGNPRYATLIICVCCFMSMPCIVALAVAWRLGSFELCILPILILISSFCAGVGVINVRAYSGNMLTPASHMKKTPFNEFPMLSKQTLVRQGKELLESRIAAVSTLEIGYFRLLRRGFILLMSMQIGLYMSIYARQLYVGLYHTIQDDEIIDHTELLFVFMRMFIQSYSFAIHTGWLVGNGLTAISSLSLESFNLVFTAMVVLGSLSMVQSIFMFFSNVFTDILVYDTTFYISLVLNFAFGITYAFLTRQILKLYKIINHPQVNWKGQKDHFIPTGNSAAKSGSFSLLSLAKAMDVPYRLRRNAYLAAILNIVSLLLFEFETIWLSSMDAGTSMAMDNLVASFAFILHFSAIFVLTFFRSVQDHHQRLHRKGPSLQFYVFVMYSIQSMFQFFTLLSSIYTKLKIFMGCRMMINMICALSFYTLRFSDENNDTSVTNNNTEGNNTNIEQIHQPISASMDDDDEVVTVSVPKYDQSPFSLDLDMLVQQQTRKAIEKEEREQKDVNKNNKIDEDIDEENMSDDDENESLIQRGGIKRKSENTALALSNKERSVFQFAYHGTKIYGASVVMLATILVIHEATQLQDPLHLWKPNCFGENKSSLDFLFTFGKHNLAYSVCFHFCFLLFGYIYRGVSSANLMFLQFILLTLVSILITTITSLLVHFDIGYMVPSAVSNPCQTMILPSWIYQCTLWIFAGGVTFSVFFFVRLMKMIRSHEEDALFPQSTHAMV